MWTSRSQLSRFICLFMYTQCVRICDLAWEGCVLAYKYARNDVYGCFLLIMMINFIFKSLHIRAHFFHVNILRSHLIIPICESVSSLRMHQWCRWRYPANTLSEYVLKDQPCTTCAYMLTYNKLNMIYTFIYFIGDDN